MAELDLFLWDDELPQATTIDIMKIAKNHLNVPPSYPITLKHYEALWGSSEVAQLNNNWGGVTWSPSWNDPHTRDSGVIVSRGTLRPAIEGGHYVKFESIADYFTDWAYFMSDKADFYNVQNAETFQKCIYGMFIVGGALGDYATMNVEGSQLRYELYYEQMLARRNAINDANNNVLDKMDNGDYDYLLGDNPDPDPDPDPDPEPPEYDFTTIKEFFEQFIGNLLNEINRMMKLSLYNYGYKNEFGNLYIKIMKQLDNMYQMNPTSSFKEMIKQIGEDGYEELVDLLDGLEPTPPDPDPDKPLPPVSNYTNITAVYGYSDDYDGWHAGLDFGGIVAGVDGDPIFATVDGTVEIAEFNNGGLGNVVWLKHTTDNYYTAYAHLSGFNTSAGSTVKKGDIIGYMGNTGFSFGTHLHFVVATELWGNKEYNTIDPKIYLGI